MSFFSLQTPTFKQFHFIFKAVLAGDLKKQHNIHYSLKLFTHKSKEGQRLILSEFKEKPERESTLTNNNTKHKDQLKHNPFILYAALTCLLSWYSPLSIFQLDLLVPEKPSKMPEEVRRQLYKDYEVS